MPKPGAGSDLLLPERIVEEREDIWTEGFIGSLELVKGAVGAQAAAEYAEHLRRPVHLRASYEYFRACTASELDMRALSCGLVPAGKLRHEVMVFRRQVARAGLG